jgi:maltose alpha-D-glucosyltransferase/alpha-amylase
MHTDPLWYKDTVIYQLHVKTFADSNGDGIGDFRGLTSKLDYIHDLGVDCIWLLPMYPSPFRDDGYDIADYYAIHPSYGTLDDFREFLVAAHERGLKVITELVLNHTSDQHHWFKEARSSRDNPRRDWYVWNDTDDKYAGTRILFVDSERSNWTWDAESKQFYWHRFFSHQPDLNYDNPDVREEMWKVMEFWLGMGVDGFRVDAVAYLAEREGTSCENLPETHDVIRFLRRRLNENFPGRMLLAEANQWPEDVRHYFGQGDEFHMAFHFPLMPRMFMALRLEDRKPLVDIVERTPEIPDTCQWGVFLRNHDELTLEMVSDVERAYMYDEYASDPAARIYVGIRRRLAPLLEGDRRRIELMNGILLSMPGAPIIYYGDEIGMGDNIYLGDRNGVRTPMQWTPDRNGGFSRCDPARLYLPIIMDPVYGYEAVNVEAQSRSLASLLSWTKRLISVRKSSKVFGRGSLSFIRPANRSVLVYVRQYQGEVVLCVANLSRSAQAAEIDLSPWRGRVPFELLGRTNFPPVGEAPYLITLAPYGFFWFLLCERDTSKVEASSTPAEFETLVLTQGWSSLAQGQSRSVLERDVLPAFLASKRWFAERGNSSTSVRISATIPLVPSDPGLGLAIIETKGSQAPANYLLPLTISWTRLDRGRYNPNALAAVRRGSREGTLLDATTDPSFIAFMLENLRASATIATNHGCIEFKPTSELSKSAPTAMNDVRAVDTEQSNTTVVVETDCVVKLFRRLEPGINPEIEVGRFLTETVRFSHAPPLLGSVELAENGTTGAIAVVHGFVQNQGDAWTVTGAYLDRFVEEQRLLTAEAAGESDEQAAYLRRVHQVGRRVAELQLALASRDDLPDFAPEPITTDDVQTWTDSVLQRAEHTLDELASRRSDLTDNDRQLVDALLSYRASLPARLRELLPRNIDAMKIRHHGDFHLGQMLIVKDDVVIIDFEGEPRRSIEDRRRKAPAARDVAGLIRSIDYSAIAALERALKSAPNEHGKIARALDGWRELSVSAFLSAYRQSLSDARLWPQSLESADRLLDFFLLEKAFYEIEYELAHRPNWLRVPLAGTWRILSRSERAVE